MRHPSLSPDGKDLAFDYHGDIWVCPSAGGKATRLTEDPADEQKPAWSPDGKRVVFSSDKAGNRDLFVVEVATRAVRQLTSHSSDDDAPAWSPDGLWVAFHSNRDSNLDLCLNDNISDVWRVPAEGGTATRVTRFRGENPAWSQDGKWIAYDRYASGYSDGEHNIFLIAADGSGLPRELAAGGEDSRKPAFKGDAVYFAHEANGILASNHRNVWKTTTAGGALIQVTGHRGDHVTWPTTCEKSGRLVYEYDFDFYSIELGKVPARPEKLRIVADDAYPPVAAPRTLTSGFNQPAWSPSGAEIAFAAKGDLWVAPVAGGDARALVTGPDEEREPSWSSDERTIVYVGGSWGTLGHLYRIPAAGGKPEKLTSEEGNYRQPRLSPDGTLLLYARDGELQLMDLRDGKARTFAAEASGGTFSPDGTQVAYLSGSAVYTRPAAGGDATKRVEGGSKRGLAWSPDGSKLAYVERGSVHLLDLEKGKASDVGIRVDGGSWSPDSCKLLCETGTGGVRQLAVYDLRNKQSVSLSIRAVRSIPLSEEMTGVFAQVWGSYYGFYYDPFFHGVDMVALRRKYAGLAAECRTKPELYALINEMIRELRSSHIHLRPAPVRNTVLTGSLAADLARNPDGAVRLRNLEPGGPAARAGLKEGETILAVGETKLGPHVDFDRLMTGETVPEVVLLVRDAAGDLREARVKGIDRSSLRVLKYENRTAWRKEFTKERSKGRLGYFHVKRMAVDEVMRLKGAVEKEFPEAAGLVLDERDGVGGMAHRPICSLLDSTAADRLNKHPACYMRNRNGWTGADKYGTGSQGGRVSGKSWDRPVVMIQNEISRSDKEILPYTFRHLGIGYLVGMPTAGGVIGGSDWTMQDGSRITVSVQGWFTAEGRNLEGWGVPPDFRVAETHEDLYAGRDAQLEKAIEVLLAQMDGRIAAPKKPGAEKKDAESSGK